MTWKKIPTAHPKSLTQDIPLTVLIPARNEAKHIAETLQAIDQTTHAQNLSVTIIDDHSQDGTAKVALNTQVNFALDIIDLSSQDHPPSHHAYKKWGLQMGISRSTTEHILLTDADCTCHRDWLTSYQQHIAHSYPDLVTGPILYHREKSILDHFQSLDILGTIGVTAAGIGSQQYYLANGGNMYIRKSVFREVGGYEGNIQHASGDDVFLIQKVALRDPNTVHFLKSKNAVVYTQPERTWRDFVNQRIRWSTKTSSYKNKNLQVGLAAIFAHCALTLSNIVLAIYDWKLFLPVLLIQLIIKVVSDYLYLGKMARYFDKREVMRYFLPSFLIHIVYIVGIGIASVLFTKYKWKGREVT